jgi:hypothetical protein
METDSPSSAIIRIDDAIRDKIIPSPQNVSRKYKILNTEVVGELEAGTLSAKSRTGRFRRLSC